MATIKLKIREDRKTGDATSIYLAVTINGRQHLINTMQKINPNNWDASKQRVKATERGCAEINKRLTHFYTTASQAITKSDVDGIEVSIEYLRSILSPKKEEAIVEPVTKGFFDIWQDFIDSEVKGMRVGVSTIKNYKTVRRNIMKYSQAVGLKLDLATISSNDSEKLCTAMIADKLASGTINHQIKNLNVFVNWAIKNDYTVSSKAKQIKRLKAERGDIHFLNSEELELIENAVLPDGLAKHRDQFLFTCYTGLRYSDLANLQPENYKADKITLVTIKTHDALTIPLNRKAKAIIAQYEGVLPKTITNQKMNLALKKIGFIAGLTHLEQIVDYKGGKRNQSTAPKYELLTCHVGRRTFIIHCLEKGMRPEVIMKITGHADIKTLMQYVKITSEAVSREFLGAWDNETIMRKIG